MSTPQKDLFSTQAGLYAAFRPTYPQALYEFIFQHLARRDDAWDCATGNGQVADILANHFKHVHATDISQKQLDQAVKKDNIQYSLSPAEQTPFAINQFDLITVGQALHWFDREKFFEEVRRVSKPKALLAVWGYALLYIDSRIDPVIMNFYNNIVGPYWDDARRLVEEEYRTISFPFEEIPTPKFFITTQWTLKHLAGYLESWSATQKYIKVHGTNPIPEVIKELHSLWRENETFSVSFPVFLRLGKI